MLAITGCLIAVVLVAIPAVALSRISTLIDARNHEAAARWLVVADRLSLRRGVVHFEAARLARRQGDLHEAKQRLAKSAESGGPADDLERERWLLLAQAGQVAAMESHWPALIGDPRSDGPEIYRVLVLGMLKRLHLTEAARTLDAWESDHPEDVGPHVMRGLVATMQLAWDDAAASYAKAIEIEPSNVEARRGLAKAHMQRLQSSEALSVWTSLLDDDSADCEAVVGRAECLIQLGELGDARQQLEALLAVDPDNLAALALIGRLEVSSGEAGRAVDWLSRAVAIRPEDAELRYVLGRALRLAGRSAEAEEHMAYRDAAVTPLKRLRELLQDLPRDPANADLRAEIGALTYRWKSHAEGMQWFATALDIDPAHGPTRRFLESHNTSLPAPTAGLTGFAMARPGTSPSRERPAKAPIPGTHATLRFSEQATERGLVFTSVTGQQHGHLTILESLGSGVGLLDYDSDGDHDVFAVGGGDFPERLVQPTGVPDALFRNDGRAQFVNVTALSGIPPGRVYSHGVNVGDDEADGMAHLIVYGYEGVLLLQNMGDGTFRSVPPEVHRISDEGWLTSAAWLDLDADGHLDLYLTRYCDWSPKNDPPCTIAGRRDVCPPAQFNGVDDRFLRGDGMGRFNAVSAAVGLVAGGKGLGVVAADLDLDGDIDIHVANDTTPNFLYKNTGDGRLEEYGLLAGIAVGLTGEPDGSMGTDVGDANLDGLPDIWVANFENQSFGLYRNFGDAMFEHVSAVTGITAVGAGYVGFGTMFTDVDLDGAEDLFVANGHVMQFPSQAPVLQRPLLFHNQAGRRLKNVAATAGAYCAVGHLGRGAAAGDLDGDGSDDIVISNANEPLALLLNETSPTPSRIAVRLIGTQANRDAVGASAILETSSRRLLRQVKGGGSYLSSSSRVLVWGLAADERPLRLTVQWPGGHETVTQLGQAVGTRGDFVLRENDPAHPLHVVQQR